MKQNIDLDVIICYLITMKDWGIVQTWTKFKTYWDWLSLNLINHLLTLINHPLDPSQDWNNKIFIRYFFLLLDQTRLGHVFF